MTSVLTDEPVAAPPESGRSRRAVIAGLLLVCLVGVAIGAVVALRPVTVELSIDGNVRRVETRAATVEALLAQFDVVVADGDEVDPSLGTELADGDVVTVQFSRSLTVVTDGEPTEHITTATSLGDALGAIGIPLEGAAISHALTSALPRAGMTVEILTPKDVALTVGADDVRTVSSTAPTVGELLAEAGVVLADTDEVEPAIDSAVTPAMTIAVTQIRIENQVRIEPVLHDTIETGDADLVVGSRTVETEGVDGEQEVTYAVTYTNGAPTAEEVVSSTITTDPITEMVAVGTKPAPPTPPPSTEAGSLNWAALADCESSGNPRAVNPAGYYGLYQFSLATWASVGGAGNPIDATPEEQLNRAQILYDRSGPGQWPTCGRLLFQ
ncbi:MAG: ubiquitin-like domain-containing protein [Actinomycetota bacterium]